MFRGMREAVYGDSSAPTELARTTSKDPANTTTPTTEDPSLAAARAISRVMDGWYVDPILGFTVPWVGDVISAGLGLYPVTLAWRRGAPKTLIARMLLNLSVDLISGAVPVLGDIWDFFFRAHRRNLDLLRERMSGSEIRRDRRATAADTAIVAGAALVFLGALSIPIVLLVIAVRALSG
jgi:hypothetical protein